MNILLNSYSFREPRLQLNIEPQEWQRSNSNFQNNVCSVLKSGIKVIRRMMPTSIHAGLESWLVCIKRRWKPLLGSLISASFISSWNLGISDLWREDESYILRSVTYISNKVWLYKINFEKGLRDKQRTFVWVNWNSYPVFFLLLQHGLIVFWLINFILFLPYIFFIENNDFKKMP